PDIALIAIGALGGRELVGADRVFRAVLGRTTVGNDFHLVLHAPFSTGFLAAACAARISRLEPRSCPSSPHRARRARALGATKPPGNRGDVHEAAPTPNVTGTSLVFEGGAMRVALAAALEEALLESDVNFARVTGNSAATSHVANYVSRTTDRMRKTFTTFPSDPNFGGWRAWLRGDGFFNAGYIYGEAGMPGQPMGMDWEIFDN